MFDGLAESALAGRTLTREEALGVLRAPDTALPALLQAAYRVRHRFHGNTVKVHVLMNAKKGDCPEDCGFCAQSHAVSDQLEPRGMASVADIVEAARDAHALGAWKFCIVTATRGPSARDLDAVCEAVERIKRAVPIRICTSLGLLTREKAERLARAGVDRFNHNLESSERFFPSVCSTHAYGDRVETLRLAKAAGMELCSGGIVGMGEEEEDVVDLALSARALDVDSIPVNFLTPSFRGSALGPRRPLTPAYCLKVLCLFRLLNPAKDIRAAGGREAHLRSLQPVALYAANSLFSEGYLTTPGQGASRDLEMMQDLGFEPLRVGECSRAVSA